MSSVQNVFVLGGTGFVGEKIVDELLKNNCKPILLVRDEKDIKTSWKGKVEIVKADFGELSAKDFSLILKKHKPTSFVYSIGLIRETKKAKFIDLHYKFVAKAIDIAKRLNVEKFVLISANGVQLIDDLSLENYKQYRDEFTDYQLTKALGEKALLTSALNFKILRPSIVWDKSKKYNFRTVLEGLIKYKIVPIFGDGKYKLQPVNRIDLAKKVSSTIVQNDFDNKTEVVCGETVYTYKELIKKVAEENNKKVFFVHIPLFIAKPAIKIAQLLPFSPITYDQLRMLLKDNVCSQNM